MKTIICGSGDVGYSIADKLSKENFEVTVVDEPSSKLNKIIHENNYLWGWRRWI